MKSSLKKACLHHLRCTFGLDEYRPGQRKAVQAVLSDRDVLCILPTGAGKSLCWQLPAVVHGGMAVVISPLIALMRDQVQHLADVDIPAVSLDSLMTPEEKDDALRRIRAGEVQIVFVSPERLAQPRFRRLCQDVQPWLVVVDEAHCAVQWGESFRPAYRDIAGFIGGLPVRPVICALTATADDGMQRAIRTQLGMRRPKQVLLPILRENLIHEVRTTLDRTREINRLLQDATGKTVIFCRSRARAEALSERLTSGGLRAAYYHAGMEREVRLRVQQRFMEADTAVLCATSAFGLGVDIPDIRLVIHDYLPDSLIDYVQQTGRAGRDGAAARCILLLEPNDLVSKANIEKRAKEKFKRRPIRRWRFLRKKWRELHRVMAVLMASNCIPAAASRAFGHKAAPCGRCSACNHGRLVDSVPSLAGMKDWQIRAWILLWQRDALAKQLHCPPGEILSDAAIRRGAKDFVFPKDASARPEMDRLLRHFRRESMYEVRRDGI